MAGEGLVFKIGADVAQGVAGVQQFGKAVDNIPEVAKRAASSLDILRHQLERLQKLAAQPLTFKQQERLNGLISKSSQELQKFDSASRRITPGLNSATLAMTNLGRVAQDLPFGFIGIANNLNPLLESFQRLKAETGSSKAALAALGSSLFGAGGLGIALSLVTAALSFIQLGFSAWTRGMGDNKKELDEHTKAVEVSKTAWEKYLEKLQEVATESSKEVAKVTLLFDALGGSNLKLEERKSIIEQLNSISGKYLGHLDAEKSSYIEISKAVEDYLKNVSTATELKALLPEFEGIIQKMVSAQVELNQLRRQKGISQGLGLFSEEDQKDFNAEEKRLQDFIRGRVNEIKVAKETLNNIAGGALSLEELLFGKQDKKVAEGESPIDKEIESIKARIAELNKLKEAGLLNREEFELLNLNVKLAIAENVKSGGLNSEQLQRQINDIVEKANLRAEVPLRVDPKKKPSVSVGPVTGSGLSGDIAAAGETAAAAAEGNKALLQMEETAKRLHDFLVNNLGQAFLQMFDDISKGGKNALQAFGQAIAGVIKRLVAAAITAAIFAAIIGAATGGKNFGQAAGEAAKFVNGMKAIFGQLGGIKLARGGITTGPTNAIIGDNPSGKEAVIPFERMGEFINQLGGSGERLIAEVSGDQLRFILLKSNRGASRLL